MQNNWHLVLGLVASVAAGALTGCDTVAELTFEDEQVIEAAVQGLVSASCDANRPENADAILRFSVLTSFDARMTPGRRYTALGDVLKPGKNFNADDIVFSDGWAFVVDTGGKDLTCESVEDCPTGAACVTAAEMGIDQYYYPPSKFCAYSTKITAIAAPTFTHFKGAETPNAQIQSLNADGRTFAFVIDNSATLDGSDKDGIPNNDTATDPWQYRKVGLNQFMEALALTEEKQPRYEFAAIFANGTGENGVYDASQPWMRSEAVWESTVMNKYPSPSGNSPIWEAASKALQKIQDSANATYARTMIAITDGAPNSDTQDALEKCSRLMQANRSLPLHWLELAGENMKPHHPYGQMVAKGCGTHYIFVNPMQFSKIMRNIALNSESYWSVALDFSATLPENYTYRLATTMVATIGNSAVTFEAQRINEQNETMDYRMIIGK